MEKLSVSKERVIEAANKCSTAKNILMVLFPEVFEVPKFEKGQWVKWTGCNTAIGRIERRCHSHSDSYALDVDGDKTSHDSCHYSRLVPLTKEEIEKHLIALYDKKGFKVGSKINRDCFKGINSWKCSSSPAEISGSKGFHYCEVEDALLSHGSCVYYKGVWAKIIQEPAIVEISMDEIAKLKGCDVSQLKIKK